MVPQLWTGGAVGRRLDLIRDVTATITAIRNIKPKIQNDMANLETDKHKVPSLTKGLT